MHLISITKQQLEQQAGFTLCTVSRNDDDVDERWKINNTNFVWSDSHNRRTVCEKPHAPRLSLCVICVQWRAIGIPIPFHHPWNVHTYIHLCFLPAGSLRKTRIPSSATHSGVVRCQEFDTVGYGWEPSSNYIQHGHHWNGWQGSAFSRNELLSAIARETVTPVTRK